MEISAIQTIKIRSESREGRPLTARVEHISPIGSLFVKLSPSIILRSDLCTFDEETESQWLTSSRPSRARGELLSCLSSWPRHHSQEPSSEVSQPSSCFLKVSARHWRHWDFRDMSRRVTKTSSGMLTGSRILSQM